MEKGGGAKKGQSLPTPLWCLPWKEQMGGSKRMASILYDLRWRSVHTWAIPKGIVIGMLYVSLFEVFPGALILLCFRPGGMVERLSS